MDQLNMTVLCTILVLSIISSFAKIYALSIVIILLYAVLFYRFFSKSIVLRSNENQKFLSVFNKCKSFFCLQKRKFSDRKTHVYKKCPHCKATVRLPRKKGEHTVRCPKCGERFEVKI